MTHDELHGETVRTSAADDFFAAARALGEQIAAQRAARRAELRERHNVRRRARYAVAPKSKPTAKPAAVEDEYDLADAGCRCHIVPMPPCGWCENGGESTRADTIGNESSAQ